MRLTFRKTVIGLAAAGALTVGGVAGVAPASAQGVGPRSGNMFPGTRNQRRIPGRRPWLRLLPAGASG
jgi:hypothetical protein